jgi:ribosomal protein S18 acetylase RimI-like enzyme
MDTRTTTTIDFTTIRPADMGDLAPVSRTLADAFAHDPVFAWCIPDPARRAAILPSVFRLFAEQVLPLGGSEITADGRATALWVPPGQAPVADDQAEDFGASVFAVVGEDMDRVGAIMAMLDEHHPSEPHHFLWFVGVESAAQGRGVGSALLASMLQRCDRDGTAAYLDATSEHNRRLYERNGFVVTAERSVDGSPPLWAMWRDPVASTGAPG